MNSSFKKGQSYCDFDIGAARGYIDGNVHKVMDRLGKIDPGLQQNCNGILADYTNSLNNEINKLFKKP